MFMQPPLGLWSPRVRGGGGGRGGAGRGGVREKKRELVALLFRYLLRLQRISFVCFLFLLVPFDGIDYDCGSSCAFLLLFLYKQPF